MRKRPDAFLKAFLLSTILVVITSVAPADAMDTTECCVCHGTLEDVHGNWDHTAAPGSGPVILFADNGHDSAGWVGDKPYFDVVVECRICHGSNLPAIHGNDCETCHPTPYDTLGNWGRGCQQGGCHSFYHQDAIKAHLPFENTSSSTPNDCNRCHDGWGVTQAKCLTCHAEVVSDDVTPPVTTANVLAEYVGPAKIDFSLTENGKVGVGRTFYQLDGGPITAAGKSLSVATPGPHQLIFWSMDQFGNTESAPNNAFFTIVADTTPPTTTSNAQSTYSQGGTITLTATDDGTQGVKQTYYRLNGGPIQAGTTVVLPATNGTITHALAFWSEDWAGNTEAQNSVSFTVTSGNGTIRLVWGNSDASGSPCPGDPEANAAWTVRKNSSSGPVVASGSGACPNWSGMDDIAVATGNSKYVVTVDWWDSYFEYDEQTVFTNVSVTTPGQVVRLSY